MRIALVSTGLGRVLRGFESYTESLFEALRCHVPQLDVVLFQGGGKPGDRRVPVPNCHRGDAPARWLTQDIGNNLEKRSFALALYPLLRRGDFDLVHYNEVVMGSALFHLRRYLGGKYKLLYCDGAPAHPVHFGSRCDFAQMLTLNAYEQARSFGISEHRLFLVPYGLDANRYSPESRLTRSDTRKRLGIPSKTKVVLTVAALERQNKRVDYVIREISRLDGSTWFLAAGQRTPETDSLEREAERLIPGRWRFVSWPSEEVPLLYGAADLFVLASLREGFGLAIVEAMLSGLPVIVHNAPVFGWISKGSQVRLVDMSVEANLAAAIPEALSGTDGFNSREPAKERFSWDSLVPEYLRMYRLAASASVV